MLLPVLLTLAGVTTHHEATLATWEPQQATFTEAGVVTVCAVTRWTYYGDRLEMTATSCCSDRIFRNGFEVTP